MAIDSKNRRMGIGIIARDREGQVIAANYHSVCVRQELVIEEAQATLRAVEFSCELGLQNIILEGDSLQVINAVKVNGPN